MLMYVLPLVPIIEHYGSIDSVLHELHNAILCLLIESNPSFLGGVESLGWCILVEQFHSVRGIISTSQSTTVLAIVVL
jgi:hypothetical protein